MDRAPPTRVGIPHVASTRWRCLILLHCSIESPTTRLPTNSIVSQGVGFLSSPTFLVLNPTSLAKPQAITTLHADLVSVNVDVAIIFETWLEAHHNAAYTNIPGYTAHRWDRKRRRGGGCAIYVNSAAPSAPCPDLDHDVYELFWIRCQLNGVQ